MYNDYERVKLLFDYTKFHIGVYLTLASALTAVLSLFKDKNILVCPHLLIVSVIFIMIAGLSGGTIVSRLTQVKSYDEFWEIPTGPVKSTWFKGETWTYIEHISFWLGLIIAVVAFIVPQIELWI